MTSGKNSKGSGRGYEHHMYVLRQNGREETGGTGQYCSGVRRPKVPREMVMATLRWMGVP